MTGVLNRRDLYDGTTAMRYRQTDERIQSDTECGRTRERLAAFTTSPDRPLTVLDVGCGTGRWFHAYRDVRLLVGIDTSPEMLEKAHTPVRAEEIGAAEVRLEHADVFSLPARAGTFDRIVSIGVFGQHACFDDRIASRFHELLAPGGRAFFTIVDASSMPIGPRKRLAEAVYPFVPPVVRRFMDGRRRTFFMTRASLDRVLAGSPLDVLEVTRRVSRTNNWLGAYFECLACKESSL